MSLSSSSKREREVGGYRIGNEIGRGSFATVYKGYRIKDREPVAIKSVLRSKLTKKLLENLDSEIAILKSLGHPHIVALIACFNHQPSPTPQYDLSSSPSPANFEAGGSSTSKYIHLIMEFCALGDLSFFIKKREHWKEIPEIRHLSTRYPYPPAGGLNEYVVKHFLRQLSSALAFLRERNLIHRDVKPQNLLLQPPPNPNAPAFCSSGEDLPVLKIADFGFARSLPGGGLAETLCGSPLYMAPEILRYEKYDAKADLWSVGAVLFEALTGRPPFRAQNHVELLRRIERAGSSGVRWPEEALSNVSGEMREFVGGLLKKEPGERMDFGEFFGWVDGMEGVGGQALEVVAKSRTGELMMGTTTLPTEGTSPSPAFITDYISSTPRQSAPPMVPSSVPTQPPLGHHATTTNAHQPPTGYFTRRMSTPSHTARPALTHDTFQTPSAATALERRPSQRAHPGTQVVTTIDEDERDYVMVEKRSVEVNALADQFARPRTQPPVSRRSSGSLARGISATGGYSPRSTSAFGTSPGSALAKAISLASMRLLGSGNSPPVAQWLAKGKKVLPWMSSPHYNHVVGFETGTEDDAQVVKQLGEICSRGEVVYEFAEVKLSQLIPPTPVGAGPADPSPLTPEATATLAEEALVLYVKILGLLQHGMEIVGAYWSSAGHGTAASPDLNTAVQWIRDRFNECLEKAEYARGKLGSAVGESRPTPSSATMEVITAEKLLYNRALDMSRQAAINELVGDDLLQCESTYEVAITMMEAILDNEGSSEGEEPAMDEEDRKTVEKFVKAMRDRLGRLRHKLDSLKVEALRSEPSGPIAHPV
ncbi:Serine/threonine-protein kinase [Saitoella coloradoensis]